MVVNMLRAIETMLEIPDIVEPKEAAARVDCARTMLGEIIKGLEIVPQKPISDAGIEQIRNAPAQIREKREPEKMITIDPVSKKLKSIKNLALDAKVLVDGKETTHQRAIGQTFQKIQILADE